MRLKLLKQNSGETIIEVLLAMTVLGLILGVSYATANRNLRSIQDAQERTEASLIAQNITEIVRAYSNNAFLADRLEPGPGDTSLKKRCINPDLSEPVPAQKVIPSNGGNHPYCSAWDTKGLYHVVVEVRRITPAPSPLIQQFDYTVTVTWKSFATDSDSQVVMRQSIFKRVP